MKGKLTLLAGIGAGYVLGTRAGRERYDQICDQAKKLWRDPRVQAKADQARDMAAEKAEQAKHVASDKAEQAGEAVKEKVEEKRGSGTPGTTDIDAGMPGTDPDATADLGAMGTGPATPGPHVTR